MPNTPKKPIEPLTTLKGRGRTPSKKTSAPRVPSDGEKALIALDAMMTDSMRKAGVLPSPPPAEQIVAPAPAPAPLPDMAEYDAMKLPVWTLVMALAWIATRSSESVTWQRDDWRREHGWPEASVPTSLDPDPDDEPHPAFYSSAQAMKDLQAKGEAGEIEVRAMSLSRNQPVVLTPLDWSYGALQFTRRFDEVWVVGGEEYVRLTVQRDHLLKAFPPHLTVPVPTSLAAKAEEPAEMGPQGLGSTVQILADAIWSKWRSIPEGFPRREDRYGAIWAVAKQRQPALTDDKRPSFDSFERAERAIREHLATKP